LNDDAKVDIHAGKDNVQGSAPCPPAIEFDLQDFWKKFKFYAEHVAPALSAADNAFVLKSYPGHWPKGRMYSACLMPVWVC